MLSMRPSSGAEGKTIPAAGASGRAPHSRQRQARHGRAAPRRLGARAGLAYAWRGARPHTNEEGQRPVHPVLRTVLQRLALGAVTLAVVSVIIFAAIEMLPGDFGQAVLGQAATEETVAAFRAELGLDRPAALRYLDWAGGAIRGDFGTSFSGRAGSGGGRSREVADLIAPRLANTLFLAGMTAAIAVPLALLLGITAALWQGSPYDKAASAVTLTTISFPEFFVAYVLILLLGTLWPVFPSLADIRPGMPLGDRLHASVLPALTLTLVIVAHMMRMTRASIVGLMAAPYVEMARLKGESPARVVLRHVLPNAWAPIATVIAFNLAYLVVGVVVVEVVFVYPGHRAAHGGRRRLARHPGGAGLRA